jgi:transcriptional antiterminator RfaH
MNDEKQTYQPLQSQWYVVRAKPRQELRALANLKNQQIEAFMPQLTVTKIRRGKRTQVVEPMFPGYLFIELDHYQTSYYKVRSTYGVAKILTFGEQPAIMPPALIADLQSINADSVSQTDDTAPTVGAKVEILQGPFKGMLAEVIKLDGESRCIVLLDWLQQRVKASFEYQELVKIKF